MVMPHGVGSSFVRPTILPVVGLSRSSRPPAVVTHTAPAVAAMPQGPSATAVVCTTRLCGPVALGVGVDDAVAPTFGVAVGEGDGPACGADAALHAAVRSETNPSKTDLGGLPTTTRRTTGPEMVTSPPKSNVLR